MRRSPQLTNSLPNSSVLYLLEPLLAAASQRPPRDPLPRATPWWGVIIARVATRLAWAVVLITIGWAVPRVASARSGPSCAPADASLPTTGSVRATSGGLAPLGRTGGATPLRGHPPK